MSKHFHNLFIGVSVLPALLIMPAVAENATYDSRQTATEEANVFAGDTFENIPLRYLGGGALSNNIADTVVFNSTFTNNSAGQGGAIANYSSGTIEISGSTFNENKGNNVRAGGTSYAGLGGAFMNAGVMEINNGSTFTGNTAPYGGAGFSQNTLIIDHSTFDSNEAKYSSGALYSSGGLTVTNSLFTNNVAYGTKDEDGVASYQYTSDGKTYDTGDGAVNVGGLTTISGSSFIGNKAGNGGAIGNGDHLTLTNSTFEGNYGASQGGAIINYLYTRGSQTVEDISINIDKVQFNQNYAKLSGGAMSTFSVGTINDSRFIGNYTEAADFGDGGGALFVGAESITKITNSTFENNTSASAGGAIMTRSADIANNAAAKLDIIGTTFKGNTAATTGGALDTYFYNSEAKEYQINIANSKFQNNTAAQGGAIFNHGLEDRGGNKAAMFLNGVSFNNNIASENGGAIYNESLIEMSGTNTFTGNRAGGKANDIYNLGTLNIAGGTTTIDGGIVGNEGVLTIANGATLNIGTASVDQDKITLNGNMLATLRSGDNAQIIANTFDGSGTLKLTMKEAGTYKVFGNAVFDNVAWDSNAITADSPVYSLAWNGGDVTATRKSVDEIAQDNELSNETAQTVSNLMDSSSDKLNDLAVKMQEKLAEGTPESAKEVEQAAAAVHPDKESVVQSVSVAVQNTVTNLASTRMSAPMVGRGGGDVKLTSGGVWAQGIFNKSKQDDAFNGYTHGIAAGLDGTFNKYWTLGAGYSYAHSDITGTVRDTEIDSSTVFVYGQYKPTQWYLNAVMNYTMSDYSESSNVLGTMVYSDYDVNAFGGAIATGYDFESGVTPELGLRYMHVNADDYVNSTGVRTSLKDNDFLTGVFGTRYSFNIKADKYTTFVPQLSAAVKYDLLSDDHVATVTMPGIDTYSLDGKRLSRIGGEFGFGLGMKHRNVDFSINYDIDVRDDYTSQTGMLKFRCNF